MKKIICLILIWVASFFILATDLHLLDNYSEWTFKDTWGGDCLLLLCVLMLFGSAALGIWLTDVCAKYLDKSE